MIKIISILISALALLLVSIFNHVETGATVTATVNQHLEPGESCIVKVVIEKGDLSGFARLQQILPFGLTATPVEIMGAKFEIQENVLKFIWISLPHENSFTISYKIETDPNETGTQPVTGSLYFISDNEEQKVDMTPLQLNFSKDSEISSTGEVERKIFAASPDGGEYKVVLHIHARSGEHTARFTDQIPPGYTVTNVESNGAKFMFSNQQASFFWNELPEDPFIKISYNLQAESDDYENPRVQGILVYGSADEKQTNIASASSEIIPEEIVEGNSEVEEKITSNLLAQSKEKSPAPQMATYVPAPQKGIFYKIQIAATRKSPLRKDGFFQKKYQIGQHVDLSEQDGWRKYMIGNFDSYSSASSFNEQTREKVKDAFVVAYKNAERISIREAKAETIIAERYGF